MSEIEQARDDCVDELVDWSVMPPGSGLHVREILDDFEAAIRQPYIEAIRPLLEGPAVCNCDEAYTDRGRHEPNAVHADYEDVFDTLRALVDTHEREHRVSGETPPEGGDQG